MKKQVLSIEQMRHLQELGVDTSKASMCWSYMQSKERPDMTTEECLMIAIGDTPTESMDFIEVIVPTFTLQDIIELLPPVIHYCTGENLALYTIHFAKEWMIAYGSGCDVYAEYFKAKDSLLDAAYNMLCWCAENGYLPTKNQPQ